MNHPQLQCHQRTNSGSTIFRKWSRERRGNHGFLSLANTHLTPHHPLYLHRTLGNEAFGSLIQAKLQISQLGDVYEQEADRVAEQVIRMRDDEVSSISHHSQSLQRECAASDISTAGCPYSSANGVIEGESKSLEGMDFSPMQLPSNKVEIRINQVGFESEDPIHDPLYEEYQRSTYGDHGETGETGMGEGPSIAELKYGGVLGSFGNARWLDPVLNMRNFAEVQFRSTGLGGTGGLTTQFINDREVSDNLDVEAAIPRPAVETKTEHDRVTCWFGNGVNASGRTTMDIFTPGPWEFTAPRDEVATRYSWEKSCKEASGPGTVRIDARPSDAAMEEFVRLGEAEHDTDTHKAFDDNIERYVGNVNRLIGDTPSTRVEGSDGVACQRTLRSLENRDLLTQFVHDLNSATDRRHAGDRHSITRVGISINSDCSVITEKMVAGKL